MDEDEADARRGAEAWRAPTHRCLGKYHLVLLICAYLLYETPFVEEEEEEETNDEYLMYNEYS